MVGHMTRYQAKTDANRAGKRRRRLAWAATVALAPALAGCSFAIAPLAESDATGSINRVASAEPGLGQEDSRRARGALALALDPQGSGARVNWDNPDSKVRGAIEPLGQPFVREDEICRDFKAVVIRPGGSTTRAGTACRVSTDAWAIQYIGFKPRS